MARQSIIFLPAFAFIACNNHNSSNYSYQCAKALPNNQIEKYYSSSFKDYTKEDLDKIANITSLITKSNSDDSEYEVFYNKRTPNSLIIDIFGVVVKNQIDKTTCELFDNRQLDLPQNTILLFHSYTKNLNDGGIVAGLTRKP